MLRCPPAIVTIKPDAIFSIPPPTTLQFAAKFVTPPAIVEPAPHEQLHNPPPTSE